MIVRPYSSDTPSENSLPTENWAEKNYQFFSRLISHVQFARGSCNAGNSKAVIAAALNKKTALKRANNSTDGWTKVVDPESGQTIRCQVLAPWQFAKSITERQKFFYCSSGRIGLIFGDADCHHAWQSPAMARHAQRIFQAFFPSVGLSSERGANDWLKVDRGSYSCERANQILGGDKQRNILGLEGAMQRVLAAADCWADYEIKGTFSCLQNGEWLWGKYGKLPIHHADWNEARLQELIDQPVIHIREIEDFVRQVEAQIPETAFLEMNGEKTRRNADEPLSVDEELVARVKKNWGERWKEPLHAMIEDESGKWLPRKLLTPAKPIIRADSPPPAVATASQPVLAKTTSRFNNVDLVDELDAFRRQRVGLMRFARVLRRVPTLDEALSFIHDQKLFSGSWSGNQRRRRRVKSILKWLNRTFDTAKLKRGSVEIGKHAAFVARKFSAGVIWTEEHRYTDEYGINGRWLKRTAVQAEFVSVFLDVVDFCLNVQPNQNGRFPTERCKRLWNSLVQKQVVTVKWCPRKFAACREYFNNFGLIEVTDRNFSRGKAMVWKAGKFFPGRESWKRVKERPLLGWKAYVARSSLVEKKENNKKQEEHNTLLHSNASQFRISRRKPSSTGPP